MVQHLASLAEKRLIVSFAPYTLSLALLKRIGARASRPPALPQRSPAPAAPRLPVRCPCLVSIHSPRHSTPAGELFPGAAKATRAYLHKEEDVEAALAKARSRCAPAPEAPACSGLRRNTADARSAAAPPRRRRWAGR